MNTFAQSMDGSTNWTLTENGAPALKRTGNPVLDLFAVIGSLRSRKEEVFDLFEAAFDYDPLSALKLSFYARDIRGGTGLGERDVPRMIWWWLANKHPSVMKKNMEFIPFFGRFDDLYCFVGTPLEQNMWSLILHQWWEDLASAAKGESVSLLAKWLKSINTSSKESCALGLKTAAALNYSQRDYRKALSFLRSKVGIVEKLMSEKRWEEIDYSFVPAQAMSRLRKAFGRHDAEGFSAYIEAVSSGKAKINAGTLFPYDILGKMNLSRSQDYESSFSIDDDPVLEQMWNALPLYFEPGINAVVMSDTSASMTMGNSRPLHTSIGLGIYFAERNTGAFHNRMMTFSSIPSWIVLSGETLKEKVKCIPGIVDNTDLEAGFDLILSVAVENKVPQAEMPKALIVISDMEIDDYSATEDRLPSTFTESMRRRFASAGYELPTLVYWNVDSGQSVFHAASSEPNTMLVSGQSAKMFGDIVKNVGTTPERAMTKILNAERYSCITL